MTRSAPASKRTQTLRKPAAPAAHAVPAVPAAVPPVVYVLSDSTGNLARHMLAALSTQFPAAAFTTRFHTFIRSADRLKQVLDLVRERPGPICHALVSADFKERVSAFCKSARLENHDLTGGALEFLARAAGVQPRADVASLHRLDEGYKRRIGAVEFTLAHDDGLGLATLSEADIVLAGVSRTGKSPTSLYLAQQGYRVANVALALEVLPPRALLDLPPKKVVGLVINPQQLVMIRNRRETNWGMARTTYAEPAHVAREIVWARQLFLRQGWPILDVTDQAIEETAAKVTELLGLSCAPTGTAACADL
jgi:regulator of PEP synthase PpsR (kinase-PPPase family)